MSGQFTHSVYFKMIEIIGLKRGARAPLVPLNPALHRKQMINNVNVIYPLGITVHGK